MEITEVRIKLMEDSDDRLQGFCSITFDNCFVVRDLKIIEGTNGPFVAMPSRKLTSHCNACNYKNHLRAQFCNQCGTKLSDDLPIKEEDGRAKLYADIAHPINSDCREMIQRRVIDEFHSERERATEPGYVSRYDLDDHYPETSTTSVHTHIHRAHTSDERTNSKLRSAKSRIQPPAAEPRAPHQTKAHQPQANDTSERAPATSRKGDFGAGIL